MKDYVKMLLLTMLALGVLTACSSSVEKVEEVEPQELATVLTWQEQYDLGMKYLLDGNYEEAVIAFTAAIELEPKKAEAYIGLADVYIVLLDFEMAQSVLEDGISKVDDPTALEEKLNALLAGNITDYAGRKIKTTKYDADGALLWYHLYTYDLDGAKLALTSYDANDEQTSQVSYTYDSNGQELTGLSWYASDTGILAAAENEYDKQGNWIRETTMGSDGTVSKEEVYTYDENSNVIEKKRYDWDESDEGEMQLSYSWYYTYNPDNTIASLTSYDGDDIEVGYIPYIYDEDGNVLQSLGIYSSDGLISKAVMEYENGQKVTRTKYSYDGEIDEIDKYEYADDGTLIAVISYDADGNMLDELRYD